MVGQGVVLDQDAVVAAELLAPIVVDAPLLRQARRRFHDSRIGSNSEIATADIDDFPGGQTFDSTADQAVGSVNPVVETI